MRVLVTGGGGFVATAVAERAMARGLHVDAPERAALDVTDAASVEAAIATARPDAVVHTAYRERDPGLEEVTVGGTEVVARACARAGVRLVHVSSDMVFPGRDEPYDEDAPVGPVTRYGRAKAAAEDAVRASGATSCIVRTSLVLAGPHRPPGRHELLVRDTLDGRSPVRFFVDEIRRPVLVVVLAEALVELAARSDAPSVVHVAGPQPMSRLEMAQLVARWHGRDPDAVPSARLADVAASLPEPRPGRVVLDCTLAARIGLLPAG